MPRFITTPFISILSLALDAGGTFAAQLGNRLDGNFSNVLAAAPAFSGSYSAASAQANVGQAITLRATLTDRSASLSNGNVTREVRDSSNQKIFQRYFAGQSYATGQQRSWARVWIPAAPGAYTYQVGAMDSAWTTAYLWNIAANLTVAGNPPPPPPPLPPPQPNDRGTDAFGWVACSSNFVPLSDAQAAALVVPAAENRPGNTTTNQYRPSGTELSVFLSNETNLQGQLPAQENPYVQYVTGGFSGTTDEIIQWGAAKWGIPADWLRAVYTNESNWNQLPPGGVCPAPPGGNGCGDLATVSNSANYPAYSRYGSNQAFQSLGIAQVKWNHPDVNDSGIGTEPLRWKSTTFNVDYMAAQVRFYFDNPQGIRSSWGDAYSSCQNWLSLGAWYLPYPWNNSGQQGYAQHIQTMLSNRPWAQPGF